MKHDIRTLLPIMLSFFIMGLLTDSWGIDAGLWVIFSCIILITLTFVKFFITSHK